MGTVANVVLGAIFVAYLALFVYCIAAPLIDDWRHHRARRRRRR